MAKYGKTLAEVLVQINGTSQTKKVLEALTQTSKELGDKIKVARAELEKLAESGGGPAYDAKKKELAAMVKEQTQLNRAVNETKKFSQSVGDILNNISNNNVSVLNRTKRTLEALLNSITPNTKKAQNQIEQLQKAIQRVTDEIARRKGQLVDLDKVMANLGKATPKQLDAVEKRLQTLLESVTKNSNAWRKYDKQMRLLQEERSRRTTAQAQDIMGGNYTKTIEGTKQAIELLKKYQGTLNATDTTAINAVTASINKMNEELETAASEKAAKVMQNPFRFSPEEINEAIKYTEKLQASVNDLDAYHKLQLQIEKAKKARDEFAENSKHEMMVSQFGQLEKLSVSALAEQKKYWEAMRDSGKYLDNPIKKLEEIAKLEKERLKEDADKVMGGDYTHTIEGTQQAIKLLEKYQGTLDATDTGAIDAVTEGIKKMNAELETATRERSEKVMQNPTGFSPEQIDEAIKYTEKLQKATPDGKEWTEYAKQIAAAKEARDKFASDAKFEIMSEQFKQFDTLSKEAAEQQTKYWEGLAKSMADTDPRYQTVLDNIQKIKDSTKSQLEGEAFKVIGGDYTKTIEGTKQAIELLKKYQETLDATDADGINLVNKAIREMNTELETAAKKSARETLTTNLNTAGTEDIKKAVEWLTKYQGTLEPLSQEWREINKEIEAGNDRLKAVSDRTKLDAMTDQFRNLNKLSTAALADQQKYWQSVLDNAQKGTAAYIKAERNLQAISQETAARREAQAGAVMGDLANRSVAEIQEAVKLTEQLRDAQKAGSAEYEIYNNEIKQAKEYLQSYIDLNKQADMEDKWNNLTTLSANALAEQKKYWQEMVNGAKHGSQELQDYQDKLRVVFDEENRRAENKYFSIANNPVLYNVSEIEESVKVFQKLRDEQIVGSQQWEWYADLVNKATEQLKSFKDGAKLYVMEKQFADLSNLSVDAFAGQKKYWQELRDSLEATDPLYTKAIDNLKQITDLENSRIKADATQAISDVKFGNWDKTIEETQQAIKLIEEYKKQLKTKSDADAINDANEAIAELNANLGKAKEALMDVSEAKRIAEKVDIGMFDGTADDIDKARKSLEAYRKTLRMSRDAVEIEKVDEALSALAASAEQGGKNLKSLDRILADLKHASMDDLQSAAKRLQEELKGATRNTEEYAKTSLKLQRVNKELERAKKEWEGQESLFIRMTKRLSVYMAAYGSLSAITSYVKDLGHANLQLSDSIADVAKTTGLNAKELAKLGEDIRAIDTRTAQEQLYELAAAAGQLGIKSEAEVAGFVRAANMITVSLNELGTEATTQLMKIATLTGESQDGTEKALLSIGSAINELTASSAAAAGPIVDLMNRMGGIAAQSKITSAQMAAIGATADALGQSVEITGTSMNKFLATLMSNTDQIAYALNMDAKALRSFINEGKTMDAVIAIFERMNDMGGLGKLAPVMGDLGSEGARMTQVLAAMAEKVDFLKGQLEISTEAYEKATSIQNEYNVKNENAIAILQRMGNALKEIAVNNVAVDVITSLLRAMYNFFSYLQEGTFLAKALASSLMALTAALISTRIQWVKTINDMSRVEVFRALLLWLKNLATGTAAFTLSWERLGKALKANWFSLVIGAVAGLVTWMIKAATYVSETAKATAKYNRELQEEKDKVDQLFRSLTRLSSKEEDRARIINEINNQYGQYLGFMLDEKDSAEKLAAAHQLINAELRKRMALNLQNTLTGKANNDYAEQLEKTIANIGTKVENIKVRVIKDGKTEDRELYTSDVMNTISEMINGRVYDAVKVTQEEVNGQIVYRQQLQGVDLDQLKLDIRKALEEEFKNVQTFDANGKIIQGREGYVGQLAFGKVESYIEDMLEERIKYQKSIITAEEQANIELRSAAKDVLRRRESINDNLISEIKKGEEGSEKLEQSFKDADKKLKEAKEAAKKFEKGDNSDEAKAARQNVKVAELNYEKEEKALRDHYTKMADNAYDYVANQREILEQNYSNIENIQDESLRKQKKSEKEAINEQIRIYEDFAKTIKTKVPNYDPWDKGRDVKDWREFSEIVTNLDSSSAKALAAAFKKIKDEAALFPDDIQKVYELFQTQGVDEISLEKLGLKDATSVADMVWKWEKQIKDKLETKFHRNTELGFIFKDGAGGKRQKDEFEAALASLEAYYNDREEIVRKNALLEEITQEELDKRLQSLEQEHLSARIELRKLMLSKENSFLTTFSHAAESEYMQGIDYNKLQTQLEKLGKSMSQGLEKKLTDDMVSLQKIVWEHQEEISRILLENDPVQKVAAEYQKSFEKLDMLWATDEQRTKNAAREKMATLLEFSTQRASLSDKDMRKQLEESRQFSQVVKTMTAEEFQAFLILLDQYAEAATNAKRQATQKAVRSLEFGFDNSDIGRQVSGQLQNIEDIKGRLNEMQSSGLTMDGSALKKQKELVEQRIALEQLKWNTMIETEKNGMNRMEVLQNLMLEKDKKTYQARLEVMKLIMDMDAKMFDESGSRIDQMQGWGAISEIKATERKRDLINAELALQQMRIDEMIRIEEEGQNRMEVIENLRMARKDALYKADRRLTELTMQEYQQRTQAANEWGTAIGNGLGEMIAGTEDAGKALVKNLATMAVQSIGQMAQMFVAKQLLLSQQNMAEAASAMTTATTAAAEATAVGAAKTAEATAIAMATPDSVLTFGASGAAKAAVISGLIAAAVAASIAIINSLFPGAGNKATSSNRKLSTGMLTYAEGNYPVLGNDGKVYDAKYEGAGMKTGIYGGGAHFGIFSEKQPEMIVDGKTTQKLILNYPYIYDAITTIAKNGRLVNAMPTFASGDYPAGMKQIAPIATMGTSEGNNEQLAIMQEELAQSREVNRRLLRAIEGGIVAHLDGLETHKTQKRNERFLKRRGID